MWPQVTKAAIAAYFTRRVRARLHCVLAMSPIGDAFRRRLRMFPALVNCCTIDWFRPWPQDALESVAAHFYAVRASPQTFRGHAEHVAAKLCRDQNVLAV